jgi:mannose-6-phosphate isomerase-like protein (cupin superfamily)
LLSSCGAGQTRPTDPNAPSAAGAESSGSGADDPAAAADGGHAGAAANAANAGEGGGVAAKAEPIDGALPETRDGKPFARRHDCTEKQGCNHKLVVPESLRPESGDPAPIVVWEQVLPAKTMLIFPKHAGLDLYGLLLDGEVSVLSDDIAGKQKRCWKLNGFRAPGVGVNVYSKEPTRAIFAAVVNGKEGSVAQAIALLEKKDASLAWKKRASPVTNFELSQKADLAWGGGAHHARIAYDASSEGAPPASMTLLLMSKNAPVAEHVHDKEWEILAMVAGDGDFLRKGAATKMTGGTIATVPPGTPHAWRPSGTTPTIGIQFYWPPGPEQRFKALAEGK